MSERSTTHHVQSDDGVVVFWIVYVGYCQQQQSYQDKTQVIKCKVVRFAPVQTMVLVVPFQTNVMLWVVPFQTNTLVWVVLFKLIC